MTHPPIFAVHTGHSADKLESSLLRPASVEFGEDVTRPPPTDTDFKKQLSAEDSELGGSGDAGSKDDLQTVVEKLSPVREPDEKDGKFSSLLVKFYGMGA